MMAEKIAHLRALLIDDGWDVERRADALRTLAEIEAAWEALLAPVDVEAEVDRVARMMRSASDEQARRAAPVDREALGRLVRDVWIAWAKKQPSPKPSWLVPWEGLAEPDREVDRRAVTTGEDAPARQCVAVLATNDAGEVLLVLSGKREGRHHDRGWELPGGKLDPGEAARDGARREAIEETGLAVVLSEDEPTVLPPSARHRGALLFRARAEGQPRPGSDAIGAGWWTPTAVLELHARGLLSDLASRAVLVEWAQNASACNVDHTTDERPRVLGGECAECLHRPPLHEPTCTKARCSHTPAASPPDRRAALAAAEHAYLVGAGWIHHPEGRIPSGPEDGWTWEEGVWEDVTDPDRNTIAGGPARWDHEHALREQLARDGHPRGRRGAAARTWSEEQIREAWYRAQETGRPGHERPREADDLANGWEHVRAALHGKAV